MRVGCACRAAVWLWGHNWRMSVRTGRDLSLGVIWARCSLQRWYLQAQDGQGLWQSQDQPSGHWPPGPPIPLHCTTSAWLRGCPCICDVRCECRAVRGWVGGVIYVALTVFAQSWWILSTDNDTLNVAFKKIFLCARFFPRAHGLLLPPGALTLRLMRAPQPVLGSTPRKSRHVRGQLWGRAIFPTLFPELETQTRFQRHSLFPPASSIFLGVRSPVRARQLPPILLYPSSLSWGDVSAGI